MVKSANGSTATAKAAAATQTQAETGGDLVTTWAAASQADLLAIAEQARKDTTRAKARFHAVEDALASQATGKPIDTSDATGDDMEVRTNSDNITNNYYVQSFDPVTTPPSPPPGPGPTPQPSPQPVPGPPGPGPTPPPVKPPRPTAGPLIWCLCLGVLAIILMMIWLAMATHPPVPVPIPGPWPRPTGHWKPNITVE